MADLSNAFWSETDASNNNASPNGWPEGMMPSGVNDAARADKGALKRFWDRINPVQYIIGPSAGIWTFTTSNPSYPTSYIQGEAFSIWAGGQSGAGDGFRVNALPAGQIFTVRPGGTNAPITTGDIIPGGRYTLVYDSQLAAGAGGFVLVNPWQPVWNTGGGSATTQGALTVSGALSATGNVAVSGTVGIGGNYLTIFGRNALSADASYTIVYDATAASSLNLGATANLYRQTTHYFQNRGGTLAYLTIDGTGAQLTGNLVISGSVTASNISPSSVTASSGSFTTLAVNGAGTALTVPAGALNVGGNATVGGTLGVTGTTAHTGAVTISAAGTALSVPSGNITTAGNLTAASVTVNGAGVVLTVPNGAMSVAGTGSFAGAVTISYSGGGYALDVSAGSLHVAGSSTISGDIVCQNITANVQGYKPAGGSWAAISDVRTKDADTVADYTRGLDAIMQLRPVSYQYNGRAGMPTGRTFVGLVADDVLPVMPEMVGTLTERLDPGDAETTDILTLDTTALTFALLNAVKALAAEIAALKKE